MQITTQTKFHSPPDACFMSVKSQSSTTHSDLQCTHTHTHIPVLAQGIKRMKIQIFWKPFYIQISSFRNPQFVQHASSYRHFSHTTNSNNPILWDRILSISNANFMPNYHSFIQQILIMKVIMVNAVDGSAYFLALWIWQIKNKQKFWPKNWWLQHWTRKKKRQNRKSWMFGNSHGSPRSKAQALVYILPPATAIIDIATAL